MARKIWIYFSDFFDVTPEQISAHGAFNISLINDLPLFIDPFLLFNSDKPQYQELHADIISYVQFLKSHSDHSLPPGTIRSWFHFPEIKQNWLGYSKTGNNGRGLGAKFANSLKLNLTTVFKDFGDETKTATHLEKLTLIKNGIGKDQISDLTCNLIVGYLAKYTEEFTKKYIPKSKQGSFPIDKVIFDRKTESWVSRRFILPKLGKDFVLLTPIDMLTKDEGWISNRGLQEDFSEIIASVDNVQLRDKIDRYFKKQLPVDATQEQRNISVEKTIKKYPEILDYFIRLKEGDSKNASIQSSEKIAEAQTLFLRQLTELVERLDKTKFYDTQPNSFEAGLARVNYLKKVIETNDGYKMFMVKGKPVQREHDLQLMFKLTWFASSYDQNSEVNNGRGPVDFTVSYGSDDKTVIEFKLAKNSKLEPNLLHQAEIYSDASKATHPPIKVILYFTDAEHAKVLRLLRKHKLIGKREVVLIDAIPDKPSASKVK